MQTALGIFVTGSSVTEPRAVAAQHASRALDVGVGVQDA